MHAAVLREKKKEADERRGEGEGGEGGFLLLLVVFLSCEENGSHRHLRDTDEPVQHSSNPYFSDQNTPTFTRKIAFVHPIPRLFWKFFLYQVHSWREDFLDIAQKA